MYCNTSNLNQRGLRCNLCHIVSNKQSLYLSAHILGKAGDFTVRGLTAEEARNKIIQTTAAPKVFMKYFFVNTVTGEKSGEMMAVVTLKSDEANQEG